MTAPQELRSRAAAMMPELLADLEHLVSIPPVAFPDYLPEPVDRMAKETLRLFREAGFANAELQKVPTGYPPSTARSPVPTAHRRSCSMPTTMSSRPCSSRAGPDERPLDGRASPKP